MDPYFRRDELWVGLRPTPGGRFRSNGTARETLR